MGKGHFHGGSISGTYNDDGTPRFKEGPEFPLKKGSPQKRWSERAAVNQDARSAAKKYRNLVSTFLAKCAVAFRSDRLAARTAERAEARDLVVGWQYRLDRQAPWTKISVRKIRPKSRMDAGAARSKAPSGS